MDALSPVDSAAPSFGTGSLWRTTASLRLARVFLTLTLTYLVSGEFGSGFLGPGGPRSFQPRHVPVNVTWAAAPPCARTPGFQWIWLLLFLLQALW